MSRPIKYDDDVLVESLRATFLELGPAATSAELARRAGVSEGTLFKRFGTKRRLFERAMHISPIEEEEWFQSVLERAGKGTLRGNLAEFACALMTYMAEAMPLLETLLVSGFRPQDLQELIGDQEPPPLVVRRQFEKYLASEMRLGRLRKVDARTLADLFLGACFEHVHVRGHFGALVGDETMEQVAQRVAGLIVELTSPLASPGPARTSGRTSPSRPRKAR